MVIFAETKGKKDDQHEDKEPPEVHGEGQAAISIKKRLLDAKRTKTLSNEKQFIYLQR